MKVFYDKDCDLSVIKGKTVAIIGYGSQGHAHAQNLNDSGVKVVVGLRKNGASWPKVEKAGLNVMDVAAAVKAADVALNLLKGALDSGKKRTISWLSESSALRREGIPDRFEFKGSVIFITNLKFDTMKSQKLRDHLDALQSRCHYLDLTLDTMRDKVLRIKQIAKDGVLFADYDFEECVQDEIVEFMEANQNRLREMSLRMALKIADLRKSFAGNWKRMAETTCMKSA